MPSAAASVAIMMLASSRKYSTRAARLSAVGDPVMSVGAFMASSHPSLIDGLALRVCVGAVEEHDLAGELGLLQQTEEVFLSAPGLGEDDGLLLQRAVLKFFTARFAASNPSRRALSSTSPLELF